MAYELFMEKLQLNAASFLTNVLEGVFAFAILVVILLIGMFVANILGWILKHFLQRIKLEKFLEQHGVNDAFVGFTLSGIAVGLLKLYVVVIFLGIAADVVQVPMLYMVASQASGYMPSLVQGVVILLAGLMGGDYVTDKMKMAKKVPFINPLAILVEVFIAYNALVIALPLLLPSADPSLLVTSFLVVLAALAFALSLGTAIAIGLGMKDAVASVAAKHRDKINSLF